MSGIIDLPLDREWMGPNRVYFPIMQAVAEATDDPDFANELEMRRVHHGLDFRELPEEWQQEFHDALPGICDEFRKKFEEALEDDTRGKDALDYYYAAEQFTEELLLKLDPEVEPERAEAWRSAPWWDESYPEYRDFPFVDEEFVRKGLEGTERRIVTAIVGEDGLRCELIDARLELGVELHGDSRFALLDIVALDNGFLSELESLGPLLVETASKELFRFCNEAYGNRGFRVLSEREREDRRETLFRLLSKVSKI
ncbi:MAG: hypothetical protein ACLFVJ_01870 [Persicimonas sp.]